MLLLTRLGEALFRYRYLRGFEKFLHGPGNGVRARMINSIGSVSVRQFGLKKAGLVPAALWRTSSAGRSAWLPRASSKASRMAVSSCIATAPSRACALPMVSHSLN